MARTDQRQAAGAAGQAEPLHSPAGSDSLPRVQGETLVLFSPLFSREKRDGKNHTVICALSQIWFSPWTRAKAKVTKHTVGLSAEGSAVTSP